MEKFIKLRVFQSSVETYIRVGSIAFFDHGHRTPMEGPTRITVTATGKEPVHILVVETPEEILELIQKA